MAYNKDEIKTPATPDIKPADDIAFFDMQAGTFFRRIDWSAFWTTFLGTFALYFFTLAPTVTLEDSGELAVASDYLGVPHPPGYPIWTLLTWLFQWIFHWGSYHGQPNPAWAVGLFSAFSGALACGLIALVVSRSGAHMLRSIKTITNVLGTSTENLICWVGGVVGGVLLALSPVLWSQSVIVEVYSLNALFFALIMVLTYRWMSRPKDDHILYIAAFMFGLGLTNHQTLVFLIFGLMAAIFFADRKLFRDALAVGAVILGLYLLWSVYNMNPGPNPTPEVMREKSLKIVSGLVFLVSPVGIFFLFGNQLMTEWKRVVITFVLIALGISFYSYMTFASEQNPPMNWGYPRTTEGFKHAITRGQYEKISPVDNFKDALSQNGRYGRLVHQVIFKSDDYISVVAQFTPYISIFALITMGMLFVVGRKTRQWIIVTIVTFVSLTFVFLIFQYPPLDVQSLFIGRVQYIQAHAVFAIWIAYGIIAVLAFLDMLLKGMKWATITFVILALLLPLLLIYRNAKDEEFIKIVGACEQNGHDFGWQFGNWQLRGAEGIKSDLTYKYGEEKGTEMWAEYPNPDYPPEMSTNAIFYGGTDPGRFVPTYMIYSAKVRPDVYLITQNALADNTYMNVMRDLYGDMIWIPSQQDSNRAFQQYVEDVQAGRIPPGAAVSFENGRVSVQGVQGVMMINGILAKMIFEHNKYKHDFFVEESYVIPWMYPYLEPHGLIMKINSEPIPELSETMVKNDMDFWAWYMELLLNDSNFTRDVVARKTFSKLRSAIAGLYAYRRMFNEAETAFRQAVESVSTQSGSQLPTGGCLYATGTLC